MTDQTTCDDPFANVETILECLRNVGPLPPPPGATRAPSYVDPVDATVARTSFGVRVKFDRASAVMVDTEGQLMDLVRHKRVLVVDRATGAVVKRFNGVDMPSLDAMVAYRMARDKQRRQLQQQQQQ